jgi:electron transfer flavoprotein beta subunit
MKAKRKPIAVQTPADLGIELKNHTSLLKVEAPTERQAGIKVNSIEELIEKLQNEAKVI